MKFVQYLLPKYYGCIYIFLSSFPLSLSSPFISCIPAEHRYRLSSPPFWLSSTETRIHRLSYCVGKLNSYFESNYIFVPEIMCSDWLRERMWCWLSKSLHRFKIHYILFRNYDIHKQNHNWLKQPLTFFVGHCLIQWTSYLNKWLIY